MPDGIQTCYEIVLSEGNLEKTLTQLATIDVDRKVVVCVDGAASKRIRRHLTGSERFGCDGVAPRIQTVAEVIKETKSLVCRGCEASA